MLKPKSEISKNALLAASEIWIFFWLENKIIIADVCMQKSNEFCVGEKWRDANWLINLEYLIFRWFIFIILWMLFHLITDPTEKENNKVYAIMFKKAREIDQKRNWEEPKINSRLFSTFFSLRPSSHEFTFA